MLNGSAFTRCAAGLGLVIGLQGGSAAPAANGQIGVQSSAAIQITVRVMPSFSVNGSNAPVTVGRTRDAEALDFSSNMKGLRFDVIAISGGSGTPTIPRSSDIAVGLMARLQLSNVPALALVVPSCRDGSTGYSQPLVFGMSVV